MNAPTSFPMASGHGDGVGCPAHPVGEAASTESYLQSLFYATVFVRTFVISSFLESSISNVGEVKS